MVLRTKFPDGSEVYNDMGDEYILIERELSPERFSESFKVVFGNDNEKYFWEQTIGFVCFGSGKNIHPLYTGFGYHVMNNSGGLFDLIR